MVSIIGKGGKGGDEPKKLVLPDGSAMTREQLDEAEKRKKKIPEKPRIPMPTQDNVIVRVVPQNALVAAGLWLPRETLLRAKVREAFVMSVGPGRILPDGTLLKPVCKPGQRILFTRFGNEGIPIPGTEQPLFKGQDADDDPEPLQLIREPDICAIFEGEDYNPDIEVKPAPVQIQ